MKTQLLFHFFCLGTVFALYAQEQNPIIYEYARVELSYYQRSPNPPPFNQFLVIFDQGEPVPRRIKRLEHPNILRDQEGNIIPFNSSIDAINYVAKLGWELVAAFDAHQMSASFYFRRPLPTDDQEK